MAVRRGDGRARRSRRPAATVRPPGTDRERLRRSAWAAASASRRPGPAASGRRRLISSAVPSSVQPASCVLRSATTTREVPVVASNTRTSARAGAATIRKARTSSASAHAPNLGGHFPLGSGFAQKRYDVGDRRVVGDLELHALRGEPVATGRRAGCGRRRAETRSRCRPAPISATRRALLLLVGEQRQHRRAACRRPSPPASSRSRRGRSSPPPAPSPAPAGPSARRGRSPAPGPSASGSTSMPSVIRTRTSRSPSACAASR